MNTEHVCKSILTPLSFIERNADVFRDSKIAVIHGEKRYTYREFGERVNRLASALQNAGLERGGRVAILAPNIPAMLEAHFGVPLAGGVLVPINIRLSAGEIQYILEHSGASVLLIDSEFYSVVEPILGKVEALKKVISIVDDASFPGKTEMEYEGFLESGSPDLVAWSVEDEMEDITINYTSGTTGKPKGVVFSHRGAYINALCEAMTTSMTPDSVYLWTLPMFHCNGWCFTWGVTAAGATHVCLRKVDPVRAWELVKQENVTHLNGAPVVLIGMVNAPNRPKKLEQPLVVTTAGAPPSPALIENMTELGAHIIHVYGLTETYGPYTVCEYQPAWYTMTPQEQGKLLARQGVRFICADGLRVVDKDMKDVPADGESLAKW
jgi:fatty-acyl-CoA synthase